MSMFNVRGQTLLHILDQLEYDPLAIDDLGVFKITL